MTLYQKYLALELDGSWIGLERGSETSGYFCTPEGARIIGWETEGIHYCFIKGYRDMVFAVNPESCVDRCVYPLAGNFKDFLRLILACGSTTAVEQIAGWDRERFEAFLRSEDNRVWPEQQTVLDRIRTELKLTAMDDPFSYVKEVQAAFDDSKLRFSNEYYDALGLERPDGTAPEEQPFAFGTVVFVTGKRETDPEKP